MKLCGFFWELVKRGPTLIPAFSLCENYSKENSFPYKLRWIDENLGLNGEIELFFSKWYVSLTACQKTGGPKREKGFFKEGISRDKKPVVK